MNHEPECPFREWPEENCYQKDAGIDCCTIARAAYQRGEAAGYQRGLETALQVLQEMKSYDMPLPGVTILTPNSPGSVWGTSKPLIVPWIQLPHAIADIREKSEQE